MASSEPTFRRRRRRRESRPDPDPGPAGGGRVDGRDAAPSSVDDGARSVPSTPQCPDRTALARAPGLLDRLDGPLGREGYEALPPRRTPIARRARAAPRTKRRRASAMSILLVAAALLAASSDAFRAPAAARPRPGSGGARGIRDLGPRQGRGFPARGSGPYYDLDSIEEDLIGEQSMRPNTKSLRSDQRGGKGKIGRRSALPPAEAAARDPSRGKEARRRRRRSSTKNQRTEAARMPPWLARYEGEDFAAAAPHYLPGASRQSTKTTADGSDDDGEENRGTNRRSAASQIQRLQLALNGIFYHPNNHMHRPTDASSSSSTTTTMPEAIPYFTPTEIREILDSVRAASGGNPSLASGCADFLCLMLTLEEEGALRSDSLGGADGDAWEDAPGGREAGHGSIMTRDLLVAAAFHYCDCVRARRAGVYDYARRAMEAKTDPGPNEGTGGKGGRPRLPSAGRGAGGSDGRAGGDGDGDVARGGSPAVDAARRAVAGGTARRGVIELYGEESARIAQGADRLKRAEIMAATVGGGRPTPRRRGGDLARPRNEDSEILRSFLVSLSDDWRALVIRSAACLYRLMGIVDEGGPGDAGGSATLTATTMSTARDAFRLYAPLAQRLGMQRLKTELENTAFGLLYPR